MTVLAVGKLKDSWVREGCAEYSQRIQRHLPLEIVEAKDNRALDGHLGGRSARREAGRQRVVVLDEQGREPTSQELSSRLAKWMNEGLAGVTFVVGGADGLPAATLARADEKLALSRLTLPHRLARLLLLEQLYRALSIIRGEPYHRA